MKKISVIAVSFFFIFFTLQAAWAESVAILKKQYREISEVVNSPDIYWIPANPQIDQTSAYVSLEGMKENITKQLLSNPHFNNRLSREFFEQYVKMTVENTIALSHYAKHYARETLLPQLEAEIRQLEQNQWEPWQEADTHAVEYNEPWQASDSSSGEGNQPWQAADTRTGGAEDFSDFLTDINSPEHLEELDFSDHLDQTASDNSEEPYATCPKFNPQSSKCWPAYTNGRTDSDTYTQCCYFGGGGSHILSEEPYLRGKKDGTSLHWTKHSGSNSYFFSKRRNWKDGQLHGIVESYTWMPQIGGPFLTKVLQYSQGKENGQSTQYKVNGERTETIWLNGVSEKVYYYNEDGSLRRSGIKDHPSGRWRDTETGRLW